jgi:2-polyprenyl-6-hydroxyphenyl methylase/3-demethylubiquinone-9 3-methyltransferase
MLDKHAALAGVHRALKPGGRFFCLTPSGDYFWYRTLAPLLGFSTRHLSTDTFLGRDELTTLLAQTGFARVEAGTWAFIPRGDIPRFAVLLLEVLDTIGRWTGLRALRGGLWVCAWKD